MAAMASFTRTTDSKARVSLPRAFANSRVIIEQISDTELRIRKARIVPEDKAVFAEGSRTPLSDRDRDAFSLCWRSPRRQAELSCEQRGST